MNAALLLLMAAAAAASIGDRSRTVAGRTVSDRSEEDGGRLVTVARQGPVAQRWIADFRDSLDTADHNKRLIRHAFEAMGQSNIRPLVDLMADQFAWIIEGSSPFSRRFDGKEAVSKDLLEPLFATFATPYRFAIDSIVAEADRVVVLGHGSVRTRWGKDYNNSYCFVIRMEEGAMVEIREYLDTALVESVFGSRDRQVQ